jgi:hypothetical protein
MVSVLSSNAETIAYMWGGWEFNTTSVCALRIGIEITCLVVTGTACIDMTTAPIDHDRKT